MFLFNRSKQDSKKKFAECNFQTFVGLNGEQVYTCFITDQVVPRDIMYVLKEGQHYDGKSNHDVLQVLFRHCNFETIPRGIKYYFPNIQIMTIIGANIETIHQSDLHEYRHLKGFICRFCPRLMYLPGNLFENFGNLEHIVFDRNNLGLIEPNILDGLDKLKHVSFFENTNYSIAHTNDPMFYENSTLDEVKNHLYEKLFTKYKRLEDLKESEDTLWRENQELKISKAVTDSQLFATEKTLKDQIKQFKASEAAFSNQVKQLKTSNGNLKKEKEQLKNSKDIVQRQLRESKDVEENLTKQIQELKAGKAKINQKVKKLEESQMKLKEDIMQLQKSEIKLKSDFENEKLKNSKLLLDFQNGVQSDLKAFIQDEKTKDFRIQIDDREFPVHKFLLTARSPTLAEILRNNPEVENLNLVDISVEIFEKILKFLYTDEHPCEGGTNFLHLFAAAGKLRIQKLLEFAATKIIGQINSENALEILSLSNKFGINDLRQKSFIEVKKKYPDIKFEDEWITDPEKLMKVIQIFIKKEEAMKEFEEQLKKVSVKE